MRRDRTAILPWAVCVLLAGAPAAAEATTHHHRKRVIDPSSQTLPTVSGQNNGGYTVNRYGYGNYYRGQGGGFGGYPAGSAGAEELQNNQRVKCEAVPESC